MLLIKADDATVLVSARGTTEFGNFVSAGKLDEVSLSYLIPRFCHDNKWFYSSLHTVPLTRKCHLRLRYPQITEFDATSDYPATESRVRLTLARRYLGDEDPRKKWSANDMAEKLLSEGEVARVKPWASAALAFAR